MFTFIAVLVWMFSNLEMIPVDLFFKFYFNILITSV